jgi:transposase-like protein
MVNSVCPKCGSVKIHRCGFAYLKDCSKVQVYRCPACQLKFRESYRYHKSRGPKKKRERRMIIPRGIKPLPHCGDVSLPSLGNVS